MRAYPDVITDRVLEINAHISDAEVARDIADTEAEIEGLKRTMEAEHEIARSHPDANERKMADFRAGARPHAIKEREQFVAFLRRLQQARVAVEAAL